MKLMDVEPVLPTKARTRSRLLTDRAVKYASVRMRVVRRARRVSDMGAVVAAWSPPRGEDAFREEGSLRPVRDWDREGRHRRTASRDARQGWTWRGMEKRTKMTMAAFPMVEATPVGSRTDEYLT